MQKPLSVTVISDPHYYSPSRGTSGAAYEKVNLRSSKLLAGSREVLQAAFEQIKNDTRSDIVLISGDVTCDGAYASHSEFIGMLRDLKNEGKRVYVITATHDYKSDGVTEKYVLDKTILIPAAKRDELYEMYREFGPDSALSVHTESMSYVARLDDGFLLFALNDDIGADGHSGFSEDCMAWIEEQAAAARKNGDFIIAMTHHPLIAPSPLYELIGKGDMHGGYEQRVGQLADMGINFMLTGHTHTHNIGKAYSKNGNVFYNISTASTVGYPAVIRTACFDPENGIARISTDWVTQPVNFDMNGMTLPEYLDEQLVGMVRQLLDAAATDTEKLAYLCVAISIKPELIRKIGWMLKLPAKWLNRVTFRTFARWTKRRTGLKKEEHAAIDDEKVRDFIISLARNLFAGENLYPQDDPHCKIFTAFLDKLDSIAGALRIDLASKLKVASSLHELLGHLAGGAEIDAYNAELKIPSFKDGEKYVYSSVNL